MCINSWWRRTWHSYSRKDTDFTRKLADALIAQQYELWVDWESIPPTVDWKLHIQKGVEEADIFLFLISPDSIKSREWAGHLLPFCLVAQRTRAPQAVR